jgi:hypothetical protein
MIDDQRPSIFIVQAIEQGTVKGTLRTSTHQSAEVDLFL